MEYDKKDSKDSRNDTVLVRPDEKAYKPLLIG